MLFSAYYLRWVYGFKSTNVLLKSSSTNTRNIKTIWHRRDCLSSFSLIAVQLWYLYVLLNSADFSSISDGMCLNIVFMVAVLDVPFSKFYGVRWAIFAMYRKAFFLKSNYLFLFTNLTSLILILYENAALQFAQQSKTFFFNSAGTLFCMMPFL